MKFLSAICMKCLNLQVRIKKIVNKYTVDYHASPSELTSRTHPLIFPWTPRVLYSLQNILNFFSNLYIAPWLQKMLKFMVFRLLENAFVSQKIESVHFYLYPQAKISPKFLLLPLQAGGNFPFPPHNVFCIFSQQKGRRIIELKKSPKLNLWPQVLINFTT